MRQRYIPNPNLHLQHYRRQTGHGLSAFKGSRMQHGSGFLANLARRAIPLIAAGVKMAKPHVKKAAQGIAKELLGKAANKFMAPMPKPKRKRPKRLSRAKRVKRATSPDIYDVSH